MCAAVCLPRSAELGPRGHRSFWRMCAFRRNDLPMARSIDLQALFAKHGYTGIVFSRTCLRLATCIFSSRPFSQRSEGGRLSLWRLPAVICVELVVRKKYDGSLKADAWHWTQHRTLRRTGMGHLRLAALMWKLKKRLRLTILKTCSFTRCHPDTRPGKSSQEPADRTCLRSRRPSTAASNAAFASPSARAAI